EQRLGACEVLCGGDTVGERGRLIGAGGQLWRARGVASARTPTPDADTQREHGGDSHPPAQGGTQSDHPPLPRCTRRRDAPPQLLARRGRRAVIVLRRLAQPFFEPIVRHEIHSPAKSASASRSLARARDNCAFDVPVSMPRVAPISSCVYPSTSCIRNTTR